MMKHESTKNNYIRYITYLFIICTGQLKAESCSTILEHINMSSVSCDETETSALVNCTVTCDDGYVFADGSTFRIYQCTNTTLSSPLYTTDCFRKVTPALNIKLLVVYRLTDLGLYCIDRHNERVTANVDFFSNQLRNVCQQSGNVSFCNITSRSSSYDIETTFNFKFENSSILQNEITHCADAILANTMSGAILLYAHSLQCVKNVTNKTSETKSANISIHSGTNISARLCPVLYKAMKDTYNRTFCVTGLPAVGIKQFKYDSKEGTSVRLVCDISSPIMSLHWKHNGTLIKMTYRLNGGNVDNPSLSIHNLTYSDSGTYTCNAKNGFGTSSSIPIVLSVLKAESTLYTKAETTTHSNISTHQVSFEKEKDIITKYRNLLVGIGAGCFCLIIIVITVVILVIRKKSRQRGNYLDSPPADKVEEPEYDGLKDNLLYVSSDQKPVEESDYTEVGDHLQLSNLDKRDHNPGTNAVETVLGDTNHQATTPTLSHSEFNNKAFEISEDVVKHISTGESNTEYAVVNK